MDKRFQTRSKLHVVKYKGCFKRGTSGKKTTNLSLLLGSWGKKRPNKDSILQGKDESLIDQVYYSKVRVQPSGKKYGKHSAEWSKYCRDKVTSRAWPEPGD